ncbi:lysis system i-spanin subunit Rz [Serratia sp. MF2]|uniref:lysis system i-spanin subunit Rz n=1 Tax=Serratia sp. MF1(2023) TaxID=3059171 RepID=UPI0027FFF156|nr:lysis system i-spanin subunit Rz [Serratia sp. MF1(2023)]MDQ7104223.1 lysis system i-spanin subunit Rz [Serratia sp. MF1(2023)]
MLNFLKFFILISIIAITYNTGKASGEASANNEHNKAKLAASKAHREAELSSQARIYDLENKLAMAASGADLAYMNGREEGKNETNRLVNDLRAGNLRLSARIKTSSICPSGENARSFSGNNETTEAEFSTKDSEFLLNIGGEADEVVKQLTACQDVLSSERQKQL